MYPFAVDWNQTRINLSFVKGTKLTHRLWDVVKILLMSPLSLRQGQKPLLMEFSIHHRLESCDYLEFFGIVIIRVHHKLELFVRFFDLDLAVAVGLRQAGLKILLGLVEKAAEVLVEQLDRSGP